MHERACIRILAVTICAACKSIQRGGQGGLPRAGSGVKEGVSLEWIESVLTLGLHQRLQQEEEQSLTSDKPGQHRPCTLF